MKDYDTMQMLDKLTDKIIKMEFANIVYVLITSMTLVSSTKLIKEEYDKDMHTKTLVHVATGKKVCDIEKHFEVMILEFNPIDGSTATVKLTAPNEVLNETPNKKIKMLNNQTPKINKMLNDQAPKEKEMKKTPQSITNSESIIHEKSDTKPHIMKLNQSDEEQQNSSLNNSHSSRQVDSGGEDHFIKTSNTKNGDLKGRFTKAPNMKNGGYKKQAKSSDITHHKDSNRTEKA